MRSEIEVEACLRDLGFRTRERIQAGPGAMVTLTDFLNKIETGEFSYVWNVPKDVLHRCLPELRRWCESKFDIYQPAPIPAEVCWGVYENTK